MNSQDAMQKIRSLPLPGRSGANGRAGARGIATTISVMLMLMALLYLVASIAHYSSMMKETDSLLAQVSSATEQFDSATYGARELSDAYGTDVAFNGTKVTFRQSLSTIESYRKSMADWSAFLAAYGSHDTAINISDTNLTEIYVQRDLLVLSLDKSNSIKAVQGARGRVIAYNLTVEVFDTPGTPVVVNDSEGWDTCIDPDSTIMIRVKAVGKYSSDSKEGCMDRYSADRLVSIETGGRIASVRYIGENETLDFGYAPGRNTYLTIDAELDTIPSYAELGMNAISSASGKVKKTGGVRLE